MTDVITIDTTINLCNIKDASPAKNEKWNCDGGATQFSIFHFPFFTHDEKWNRYEDTCIFDFLISIENEKWNFDVIVLIFLRE